MKFIELTGKKFGRFTVLERVTNLNGQGTWRCLCECGKECIVRSHPLRTGHIQSCGCKAADQSRMRWTKHGKSRDIVYIMLRAARQRSKLHGIPFDLKFEDLSAVPEICPVLGIPIRSNVGGRCTTPNSPSLDRIVPSLGYVCGNVRIISHRANQLKNDATIAELKLILSDAIACGARLERDVNSARVILKTGLGISHEKEVCYAN